MSLIYKTNYFNYFFYFPPSLFLICLIHMERIISSDGHRATIRWRGVLNDSKGNSVSYIGVEWDEKGRGKHNGEFRGKKLFNVSTPNSGSFLRYGTFQEGTELSNVIKDHPCSGGFLSIDSTNVERVGNITEFAKPIKIVNASNTLVGSSQFIWDLLDIKNSIIDTIYLGNVFFVEFPKTDKKYNLKEIYVNNTNINEEQTKMLLEAFPELELIDISFDFKPSLFLFSGYDNLKEIHIDGVNIDDFDWVSKIVGGLQNLEVLSLCNNQIFKINYTKNTFLKLKVLILKSNKISGLFELDGISSFPKIEDLEIQRNTIQEKMGEVEARLLCIARFPMLKKLNGSLISPSELKESELQYLEYFSKDVLLQGTNNHPRWNELCAKYGSPCIKYENIQQKKRVEITFVYENQTIKKTIPLSMKIGTLTSHVARMFKIQGTEIELAIQTGVYKSSLTYPEQTLNDVGCNDESIIFASKIGCMNLDENQQAKSFKIRSISHQIQNGI